MSTHPPVRHVLSADQFTPDLVRFLFAHADLIRTDLDAGRPHRHAGRSLAERVLYRLFFKESTRTYESFGFAATYLGMSVLGTQTISATSVAKGESFEDTIRTINSYDPSLIVLRTAAAGEAIKAAEISNAPIISGGDGSGEHPTQALLDLYTIQQELGRLDNLEVVFGVDPLYSRTIRSLAFMLAKFSHNRLTFVSPEPFRLEAKTKTALQAAGATVNETDQLTDALRSADVAYWNRFQVEHYTPEQTAYMAAHPTLRADYALGPQQLAVLPPTARVLDPLPRVGEIAGAVDADPRAAYFRQMRYGLLTRMTVIEWVLGYLD